MALKLPTFYKSNPAMWFHQVGAQFTIQNPAITDDNTKFAFLLSALPADIAELMEFAVENATEGDKYSSFKATLIKQFGLTKTQKAKELASFTILDPSMTSTTLLMHMHPLQSILSLRSPLPIQKCHASGSHYHFGRRMQRQLTMWLRTPRSLPIYNMIGCRSKVNGYLYTVLLSHTLW